MPDFQLISPPRILNLLRVRCHIRRRHDLPGRAHIREEEPFGFPVDLFDRWIRVCDVSQGDWYCDEVDFRWQQSVHAPFNLCLHHLDKRLHPDTNELFQQGPEPVSYFNVGSNRPPAHLS